MTDLGLSIVSNNSSAIPPEKDEWLDNEAVCRRLGISKRTLQSYRDTGRIPFSIIGHKCYYKESDITDLLNAKSE